MTDETEVTAEERAQWRKDARTMFPGINQATRVLRLLDALDAAERARTPATPWDVLAINPIRTPATTAPSDEETHDISEDYDFSNERAHRVAVAARQAAASPAEPPADSSGATDWHGRAAETREEFEALLGKVASRREILATYDVLQADLDNAQNDLAALRADRDALVRVCSALTCGFTHGDGVFLRHLADGAISPAEPGMDRILDALAGRIDAARGMLGELNAARQAATPDEAAPPTPQPREIPFAAQREAELRATERPAPRPTR